MKILEINKYNFLNGGADKHFLDLVELLQSKNNEVAVFSMDHPKNKPSNWKKYFLSYVGYNETDSNWREKMKGVGRMFYSFEAKRKIKKLLEDFSPDIVHIHNIYHQISPSILGEIKKRHIPIVMTVHDYKLICPNYLLESNGLNWEKLGDHRYLKFVLKKGFKKSYLKSFLIALEHYFHKRLNLYDKHIDLYISPSEFTKNKLVRHGIRENKIEVLPHFAAPSKKEKSPTDFNEDDQKNISEKYAIYYGKISSEKGIEKLLDTFSKLSTIKLYLAGSIEEGFLLETNRNIKYLGFLKPEKLEKYIQNSLFVVSFSQLPETFGLIALEAISLEKPFVGLSSGAYGEVIENNQTGFICQNVEEAKKKIVNLIEDEKLRNQLSKNTKERSKHFNSSRYYENLRKLFDSLLV